MQPGASQSRAKAAVAVLDVRGLARRLGIRLICVRLPKAAREVSMGALAMAIDNKLRARFAPVRLEIEDDSARHRGHVGHREGGETHFKVQIVSVAFEGKNRVERQR